jgi:hypothetical protein
MTLLSEAGRRQPLIQRQCGMPHGLPHPHQSANANRRWDTATSEATTLRTDHVRDPQSSNTREQLNASHHPWSTMPPHRIPNNRIGTAAGKIRSAAAKEMNEVTTPWQVLAVSAEMMFSGTRLVESRDEMKMKERCLRHRLSHEVRPRS